MTCVCNLMTCVPLPSDMTLAVGWAFSIKRIRKNTPKAELAVSEAADRKGKTSQGKIFAQRELQKSSRV